MSEWYDSQQKPSSNIRKLLQQKIEKASARRELTAEETKRLSKLEANDWFQVYQSEISNDWDILVPKVLNSNNKRHRDWVLWNDPIYSESTFPNCLPPYEYDSNFYYINGTVMVVKNVFLSQNPLNSLLFWGQGEDVEWSLRVRQKAKLIKRFDLVFRYLKFKNDDPSMDKNWNKNLNILLKKNK